MSRQGNRFSEIVVILTCTILASVWVWTHTSPPDNPSYYFIDESKPQLMCGNAVMRYGKIDAPDAAKWSAGKSLFKSNCASCHNPKIAQTGPALMGVTKRWEDAGMYKGKSGNYWLHEWITDWSKPANAGYPYAVQEAKYSPVEMNRFPNLTDADIEKILYYIEMPDAGNGYNGRGIAYTGVKVL